MRVGLVCPYSLTLPGGVQNQTLGLARSLRAAGHDARVLAPCDGPPPDVGVTPLGNCVPLASNGSVAGPEAVSETKLLTPSARYSRNASTGFGARSTAMIANLSDNSFAFERL